MNKQQEAKAMALQALDTMPPAAQLTTPLDYIVADHFRQRVLCSVLDDMAETGVVDRDLAAVAQRFLKTDFATHVIDEEEDLFPLLRRRSQPEDRIEDVLGDLSQEHASDKIDVDAIVERLQAVVDSDDNAAGDDFRSLLRRFTVSERRHLIVENAIVMPLARARLTKDDLRNLGRRMAARRGLDYPDDANAD